MKVHGCRLRLSLLLLLNYLETWLTLGFTPRYNNDDLDYSYSYRLNSGILRNPLNNYNNYRSYGLDSYNSSAPSTSSSSFRRPASSYDQYSTSNYYKDSSSSTSTSTPSYYNIFQSSQPQSSLNSKVYNRYGFSIPSTENDGSFLRERDRGSGVNTGATPLNRRHGYYDYYNPSNFPSSYYSRESPYRNYSGQSSPTSSGSGTESRQNQTAAGGESDLVLSQILDTTAAAGANALDFKNRLRIYELLYANNSSVNDEARQLAGRHMHSAFTSTCVFRYLCPICSFDVAVIPQHCWHAGKMYLCGLSVSCVLQGSKVRINS